MKSMGAAAENFEMDYARHLDALARLRQRAKADPSLEEFVHCLAWALDARADDYERGYRKGTADAQKKAAARMRAALAGLERA